MIKILRKELFTWAIGCKTYPDLSGRTKAVFLPQIHGPVCKKFQVFYKNYQNEWVSKVSGYKDQNPKKKKTKSTYQNQFHLYILDKNNQKEIKIIS